MAQRREIHLWSIEWGKETDHGDLTNIQDVVILAGSKQESAIKKWRTFMKKKGHKIPSKFTIESMGYIDIF